MAGKQFLEPGVLSSSDFRRLHRHLHTAILLTPGVKGGVGNGMLAANSRARNPGFSLAEDTDDLFVGKTLLHGNVLMWLMKTLLTSMCINQWEQVNRPVLWSTKTGHRVRVFPVSVF
jgi:hypothetical protein